MGTDWLKLFERAVKKAREIGLPIQAAEDVAGNLILRFLERGEVERVNRFTIIDEVRRSVGRSESKRYDLRRSLVLPGSGEKVPDRPDERSVSAQVEARDWIDRTRDELRRGERMILEMMERGMNAAEIAKELGVSPARISHRVKRIKLNAKLEAGCVSS